MSFIKLSKTVSSTNTINAITMEAISTTIAVCVSSFLVGHVVLNANSS